MNAFLRTAFVVAIVALATAARAHVAVQPATAVAGAEETLSFVVGHGCDGQDTTALRVELPSGVKVLMPDTKPGWTLDTERLAGGGRALTWRGELPAHQADGFKVHVKLPPTPGPLSFSVAQSCGAVTVAWNEPVPTVGPKPKHPAPSLMLIPPGAPVDAPAPAPAGADRLPAGVQRLAGGGLANAAGLPLYVYSFDTMVGMSHCEEECAQMWPPLKAPASAKPFGDWTLVSRFDGSPQWALKDKPLYTYSKDQPGQPATGLAAPNWKLAR